MTFKLKSGNTSAFKNLGSGNESPAKQKGDNLKRIATEKKALAKKTGTFYAPGAEPKVKVPNVKGFNVKGSSASTTPGYSSTKAAKTKTGQRKYVKYNAAGQRVNMMGVPHGTPKSELTNVGSLKKQPKSKLPKNFNVTGSSKAGPKIISKKDVARSTKQALKNVNTVSSKTNFKNKLLKGAGKVVGKAGKFLGGKTLGVAGMLMGTTSKADRPKVKKSEGEQIRDILTKHKLKGGRK